MIEWQGTCGQKVTREVSKRSFGVALMLCGGAQRLFMAVIGRVMESLQASLFWLAPAQGWLLYVPPICTSYAGNGLFTWVGPTA